MTTDEATRKGILKIMKKMKDIHGAIHQEGIDDVHSAEENMDYLRALIMFTGLEFARTGCDVEDADLILAFREAFNQGQATVEAMNKARGNSPSWFDIGVSYHG